MACLKSLTSNTNQPYRKVHSFTEEVSIARMRQIHCNCLSGKSYISPFISYQSKSDKVPLLPFLKPAKSSRDLFGCESCYQDINTDSRLQNLKNSVNIASTNMPVAVDTNFILSAFAALAVNEMPVCVQQSSLDKTTTLQHVNPPVLENISKQASATTNNTTCNIVFSKETLQDSSTETHVASSSAGENNITCCSDLNVTVESIQSVEMPSSYQCSSDLSVDKSCFNKSSCSSSKTQNCQKIMQSKPTLCDSNVQSPLKSIVNLMSVLSAPRKTVKKGRPSSRKQKKRQREKQKRGLQPLQAEKPVASTHTGCDTQQNLHSQNTELMFKHSSKMDVASNSSSNPQCKAANGVLKPECPLTHFFVRLMSCSEDENSVEDDDDDDDDDGQCKTDVSINKHKEMPCPPITGFDFGCALDLDTIFKKTIPLGPVSAEKKKDGSQKNTCQKLSERDHFEKSSTVSTSPVSKDVESCFFTPALSLDILFCKKPASVSQAGRDQHETTVDFPDNVPSDDSVDPLPAGNEADSKTLEKINALWNENYPTADYRSCSSVSTDEIKYPAIKVHFAAEPDFLTVHIVGTEDRNGNWHHIIREREHFERRIQELEQILSPFLETSHRAKVLKQRKGQEQQ
ncbi:unnamed protein product [Candidula unifasciata]|uniref:Uncharacterized protein n=1 Tax=Candidula unifasciata TaxID=100452 RepID=A0A8S4A1D7_9EUPU|nr:unnamed protein product [Candidula unifasciata]